MSSKFVGWLVGVWDGIIWKLRTKSGIIKNSGINLISFVHIFPELGQWLVTVVLRVFDRVQTTPHNKDK